MNSESLLLINGELTTASSGKTYANIDPATEQILGQVADADTRDMAKAIDAARFAFDNTDWANNHEFRLRCLTQLKEALQSESSTMRQQISAETGAPLGICGDMGPHCDLPIGFIDYTLKQLPNYQWSKDIGVVAPMGQKSRRLVEKEAIGVVGCITPWNVPLQINLAKCISRPSRWLHGNP